jgi:hypothetical protein
MAQLSAFLNLLGALLVFLSFQATSTDFFLVTTKENKTALCVGKSAMFVMGPGTSLLIGTACPEAMPGARPTAVVNTDAPWLAILGWALLFVGFFFQLFSIEAPKPNIPVHVSHGPRQRSPKSK